MNVLTSSQDRSAEKTNRLISTRRGAHLVTEYWDNLFTAREQGKKIVWYNGHALNPLFQAAGLAWCHGEAFAARLAAQHLEVPAQRAGEEYGYINELCSYSRTHLGCAVLGTGVGVGESGLVGVAEQQELASRLPTPDFFVNGYQGCSTGQQWDQMSYRVLGKEAPIFTVSLPYMFGSKPDAGYLVGEEWDTAIDYVVAQLKELITFLELQTGKPFPYDELGQIMTYIKDAAALRREALAMAQAKPAPATYWDWAATIAHINFMPAGEHLVEYFRDVRDETADRLANHVGGVANERYRLMFDGIMNWNKMGFLARKFADYDAAVICGRYTHQAFWQEPDLIDPSDPLRGMAVHYLLCSNSQGFKTLKHHFIQDCTSYDIDAVLFHASRTCRAYTNHQHLLGRVAEKELHIPTAFFEGDIADAAFYKDEILESRLEALLETIDAERARRG